MPPSLAIKEGVGYHARYSRISQPDGTNSGFVHFTVQCKEGPACRQRGAGAFACQPVRQPRWRDAAGQTPRDKEGPLG